MAIVWYGHLRLLFIEYLCHFLRQQRLSEELCFADQLGIIPKTSKHVHDLLLTTPTETFNDLPAYEADMSLITTEGILTIANCCHQAQLSHRRG